MTDAQMDALIAQYEKRMQAISDDYLRRMGEHLRDIGKLTASDVNRLTEMRRMRMNVKEIRRKIIKAANISEKELDATIHQAAAMDADFAAQWFGYKSNLKYSAAVRQIINSALAVTRGSFDNISNTTVSDKLYSNVIDQAISAVRGGVEDYHTAIRREVQRAAAAGLRVDKYPNTDKVRYASGVTRRLDTAVRQNLLDGIRAMNNEMLRQLGEEYGANGVEISAHALCAEDHLPYQGNQYSNEEFERIQASLKREIGMWNCKHTIFPIVLGISPKTYTQRQLDEMRENSTEQITIGGSTMSRYQWSQQMRKIETQMRYARDDLLVAKAMGDTQGEKLAAGKIDGLMQMYNQIGKTTKIGTDYTRTRLDRMGGGTNVASQATNSSQGSAKMDVDSIRADIKSLESQIQALTLDAQQKMLDGDSDAYNRMMAQVNGIEQQLERKRTDLVQNLNKTFSVSTNNKQFVNMICDLDSKTAYNEAKIGASTDFDDILATLSGGDMTKGSCASVGLAYIGRKYGLDVLDFRDGESREWFSSKQNKVDMFNALGVNSITEYSAKTSLTNGKRALEKMEADTEYYFAVGRHAAIVRVIEEDIVDSYTGEWLGAKRKYQYLELQSKYGIGKWLGNGWQDFDKNVSKTLKDRFACESSSWGGEVYDSARLTDISQFENNDEFRTFLGYINTNASEQKKGDKGSVK